MRSVRAHADYVLASSRTSVSCPLNPKRQRPWTPLVCLVRSLQCQRRPHLPPKIPPVGGGGIAVYYRKSAPFPWWAASLKLEPLLPLLELNLQEGGELVALLTLLLFPPFPLLPPKAFPSINQWKCLVVSNQDVKFLLLLGRWRFNRGVARPQKYWIRAKKRSKQGHLTDILTEAATGFVISSKNNNFRNKSSTSGFLLFLLISVSRRNVILIVQLQAWSVKQPEFYLEPVHKFYQHLISQHGPKMVPDKIVSCVI